jgi:hypothetical protein
LACRTALQGKRGTYRFMTKLPRISAFSPWAFCPCGASRKALRPAFPSRSALVAVGEERSPVTGSGTGRARLGYRRSVSGAAGMARRRPAVAAPGGGGTNRRR